MIKFPTRDIGPTNILNYLQAHTDAWRKAMSLRFVSKPICLSALLLAAAASVLAQRADRATVTGVVTDPTGKSIPAAVVKVRSDDTGLLTDLTTNEAGAYSS